MKKPILLLLALTLPAGPVQAQRTVNDALRRDMEYARKKVYPALVNITVVSRYFQGGRALRAPSGGSGVIVTPKGHVLTNYHVAGRSTQITCTLPSGEFIEATVVTHDPLTDLSVLRLRTDKRADPKQPLPYAKIGNSDLLQVGDYVMAMGNPMMLSSSMTLGIVSNAKRVFTDFIGTQIEEMEMDSGETTGVLTRWIQHDALILPGNSGGPLVNLRGEVVGINTRGGNGVGFATPSNIAAQVLQQALEYGKVRRGWLGLNVLPVEKIGRKTGALVSAVVPSSPAEKAGVKPGDILLAVNDSPVTVRFFEEVPLLYQKITALHAGRKAVLRLLRADKSLTLTATVSPMEPFVGEEEELRDLGVTVQEITAPMARSRRFPDTKGVVITGIRTGYPFESAQPSLTDGDMITAVDGKPVAGLTAFRKAIGARGKKEFAVAFRRDNENLVSIVKVPEEKSGTAEGGELPHAWLGVKTQVVTPELARALRIAGTKGFRITQVYPWTEASKGGLKIGDVITAVNGTALDASRPQDAEDLKHAIEELTIGEKADLSVLREGKPKTLKIVLEEPPPSSDSSKRTRQKEFEFSARDITPLDRMENFWPKDQTGLMVTEVTAGGWANMSGLRVDDLILSINGQPITGVETFEKRLEALLKARPKVLRIFVKRGSQTYFVFIEPDWSRLTTGR